MPTVPRPTEPCPEGYHWEIREITVMPFEEWVCVKDPIVVIDDRPEPPPQPEDPAAWPWPLNLIQAAIEGFFGWLGDMVTYGFDAFQYYFDGVIGDLRDYLTDVGDWLKGLLVEFEQNLNTFLKEKFAEFGEGIKTLQAGIQSRIDELSEAISKKVEELQKKAEDIIKERIEATEKVTTDAISTSQQAVGIGLLTLQTEVTGKFTEVERRLDVMTGGVDTLADVVTKHAGPAVVSFASGLVTPFLKQLNTALQEV